MKVPLSIVIAQALANFGYGGLATGHNGYSSYPKGPRTKPGNSLTKGRAKAKARRKAQQQARRQEK